MSKRTHAEALETRKNIMDAARNLFVRQGFSKTSLSDIAKGANVTRGAVYWHFANKNELLSELCVEFAKDVRLTELLSEAASPLNEDPLSSLKGWVRMHFSDDAGVIFSSAVMEMVDSIMYSSDNSRSIQEARSSLLLLLRQRKERIEDAICNIVNKRQLPADLDVELAVSMVECTLLGFVSAIRNRTAIRPYSRYNLLIDMLFDDLRMIRKES